MTSERKKQKELDDLKFKRQMKRLDIITVCGLLALIAVITSMVMI
jgi:hypothetical protein